MKLAGGVVMTITEDRAADAPTPEIGKARTRKEDQRLITGRTRWTDNIQLPGMLHLAMVRSPFAHATDHARSTPTRPRPRPASSAVVTGEDLKDVQGVDRQRVADQCRPEDADHLPVVVDHVACAGEIVAVVAARTRRRGARRRRARRRRLRRAAGRPRPQGGRQGRGARPPRPRHQHVGHLDSSTRRPRAPAATSRTAIATAREDGIVIEREFRQQRLIPAFMEPRSTVVDPTGEQMTVWTSTQVPHILRFFIAATTGMPESKVRVIAPDVGGGFGGKLQTTPEEFATIAVARRLGKPCKYTETRSRVAALRPPRPRPVAEADAQRAQGRHRHRAQGRAARRPRRLRRRRRRRRAGARRVDVQLDLQVRRLPLQRAHAADQQDVGRRLPRGRSPRGDLRHRADDGRARGRGRASTRSRSARRTGSRTTSSRSPRWRA